MKLTNLKVINILSNITKLSEARLKPIISLKLFKIIKTLESSYKDYSEIRSKIKLRYIINKKIIKGKENLYSNDINELLNIEIDFTFKKLNISEFFFLNSKDEYIEYPFTTKELFVLEDILDI